jgi:hypothetical protein
MPSSKGELHFYLGICNYTCLSLFGTRYEAGGLVTRFWQRHGSRCTQWSSSVGCMLFNGLGAWAGSGNHMPDCHAATCQLLFSDLQLAGRLHALVWLLS